MKERVSRVVVITGGTSGIGKSTADLYRKNGDKVVVLSLSNPDNIDDFIMCDVSNEDNVVSAFKEIEKKYGHIDILINNAGYGISGATELISLERAEAIFQVNVFGVFNCSKYALPLMSRGSKIINIASACALFPLAFRSLYCASKASVALLSYSQRMELNACGIEVDCVCPGDVKTNFTKNREKHFDTNERYGDRVKNAAEKIDSKNDQRMSPMVIANKLFKMGNKKKNKPLTIISAKIKLLYFVSKIVPMAWVMHFNEKIYGGFTK